MAAYLPPEIARVAARTSTQFQPLPRDRHVRRDGQDYATQFLSLLPTGQAWPREPDSILVKALTGLVLYWGFVDGRAADLLTIESDPRKTIELLSDWERAWGLPDPCYPEAKTIEERRRMLLLHMTLLGGQSRAWFEWIGNWLGDIVEIREYAPFTVGLSEVGDTRDEKHNYRWEIGSPEMRFYWSLRADTAVLQWFRTGEDGGECGYDPQLRWFMQVPLDCLFQRWRPAHTQILFAYDILGDLSRWAGLGY